MLNWRIFLSFKSFSLPCTCHAFASSRVSLFRSAVHFHIFQFFSSLFGPTWKVALLEFRIDTFPGHAYIPALATRGGGLPVRLQIRKVLACLVNSSVSVRSVWEVF
jgi:hypothetical protein